MAKGSELRKEIRDLGLTLQVLWLLEILSGYAARGMERSSIFSGFATVLIDLLSKIVKDQNLEVMGTLAAMGILGSRTLGVQLGVEMTDDWGNHLKVSFTADRRKIKEQMARLKEEIKKLREEDNRVMMTEGVTSG